MAGLPSNVLSVTSSAVALLPPRYSVELLITQDSLLVGLCTVASPALIYNFGILVKLGTAYSDIAAHK